ncbi:MAG: zf-HC2 domain-containing protein [Phycisphaerales bacterium]|nr:MAG: zf-HC2 domain-containing protein [Phycisphaerales bacterium]
MNCESAVDLINRRIDGELTDAERFRLDEHLADCPTCRELSNRMNHVVSVFAAFRAENQTILEKHAPARPTAYRLKRVAAWAVPAAFAAAACLVLLIHVPSRFEPPPDSPIINLVRDHPAVPAGLPRRPVVQLVGESRDKYLAAEVDSGVQNVRLIYVFPVATKTEPSASQPEQDSSQENYDESV